MDRTERLLAGATRATRILEIGPSHAPIAPRAGGWNTRIVDHAPAEELRAKYRALGVDPARIEEVDVVWHGGDLAAAMPAAWRGRFDLVIASHVVEHIPDLAGFLHDLQHVLAPEGRISLAVPDKRYCFDIFKPLATAGDILAARGTAIHSRRTAWNHTAYSALFDGTGAWGQHPIHNGQLVHPIADALAAFDAWRPDGAYQDYHAWQFTPSSFALIILELGAIGAIDWRIDTASEAMGCEFFATLTRGAEQPADLNAARFALLVATQRELAEGTHISGLSGGGAAVPGDLPTRMAALEAIAVRQAAQLDQLLRTPAWARALAALARRLRG